MIKRLAGPIPGMVALLASCALGAAAGGPPTKAEAEAILAGLRTAAAARDCAAILAAMDDFLEIKTTLRLGPSDRLFVHTREELVTELPKLLTPAAAPRVQTHILSLTAASDEPAALMKYQWVITLARPEGDLRVEATGGAILQRAGDKILIARANQLIRKPGREGGARASSPSESKNNTKVWESPKPKKKAVSEPGDQGAGIPPAPGTPLPTP